MGYSQSSISDDGGKLFVKAQKKEKATNAKWRQLKKCLGMTLRDAREVNNWTLVMERCQWGTVFKVSRWEHPYLVRNKCQPYGNMDRGQLSAKTVCGNMPAPSAVRQGNHAVGHQATSHLARLWEWACFGIQTHRWGSRRTQHLSDNTQSCLIFWGEKSPVEEYETWQQMTLFVESKSQQSEPRPWKLWGKKGADSDSALTPRSWARTLKGNVSTCLQVTTCVLGEQEPNS